LLQKEKLEVYTAKITYKLCNSQLASKW